MAFKFKGLAEMQGNVRRYAKEFPERLGAAIKAELEVEAVEVRARTPVDTGNLRDTIEVTDPVIRGTEVTCSIRAGGPTADGLIAEYAIYVHENLEAHHDVGQAKFLESVLNESAPHMSERIAERMQESQK